MRVTRQRIT